MALNNKNIVVFHASEIIFLGVVSLLKNAGYKANVFQASDFDSLEQLMKNDTVTHVLAAPQLVVNSEERLRQMQHKYPCRWFALVAGFYPFGLNNLFDDLFFIDQPGGAMLQILTKNQASENASESADKLLLSDRELDVLKLLVEGKSNKEIADKLFISTHTVISHRKNIVQKTGIKSVSGLTIYAVTNKHIEVDNYFT